MPLAIMAGAAVIVALFVYFSLENNQEKNSNPNVVKENKTVCKVNDDCVNTCCGCLNKNQECNEECELLIKRDCICAQGRCIEKTANYVALEDIIGKEEKYVGKEIQTIGNIVETHGFNVYYVLLSNKTIEKNIHPLAKSISVHYANGDTEKIASYKHPQTLPRKYIRKDTTFTTLLVEGVMIDRGEGITDIARYSLKISEIKELDTKN